MRNRDFFMRILTGVARRAIAIAMVGALGGCAPSVEVGSAPHLEPPRTIAEARRYLATGGAEQRILAAISLPAFGAQASEALPELIANLFYQSDHDVRRSAAVALGEIGPAAGAAVSSLMHVLRNDVSITVRVSAADALGKIGQRVAVPELALSLDDANTELAVASALAIARITSEPFPDSDGTRVFRLDEHGVPLIVVAAIEWWEAEGQFQEWR